MVFNHYTIGPFINKLTIFWSKQYTCYFLLIRCVVDETLTFHDSGKPSVQRFSFRAFAFRDGNWLVSINIMLIICVKLLRIISALKSMVLIAGTSEIERKKYGEQIGAILRKNANKYADLNTNYVRMCIPPPGNTWRRLKHYCFLTWDLLWPHNYKDTFH